MGNYAVWTFNVISDLIDTKWFEVNDIFIKKNHTLSQGNVIGFLKGTTSLPKFYPQHRLMFEEHLHTIDYSDAEEYFIPIPLKCIGLNPKTTDAGDSKLLGMITSAYPYFDFNVGKAYWEKPQKISPIQSMRMHSYTGRGYYSFLRDYSNNHGDIKHILIGYSQGGLTARYLAFLDKHVFREDLIAGLITIGSPNYGSPLANTRACRQIHKTMQIAAK